MSNLFPRESTTVRGDRFTIARSLALLFVFFFVISVGFTEAHAVTRNVPGDYPTIQLAVNAALPGDTILLAPGVYPENIIINKRLTLQGAGSGNTAADSIIQSAALNTPVINLIVGGDNSTDRLVIQDVRITGASGNSQSSGITVNPLALGFLTFDNVSVVNNSSNGISLGPPNIILTDVIIRNSNISQNGGSGLRTSAASGGLDKLVITDSHFDANSEGGLTAYSFTLSNWNIKNSTFNNNIVLGYGMYIEGHMVHDIIIECSQFNNNVGTVSSGIVLSPLVAGDLYSNITIRSSQLNDNPFAGLVVQPNLGAEMLNIALECDAFERNDYGIVIFDPGVITNFSVHNSNFVGNTTAGLYNLNAALIDATLNWWGAADGPSGDGSGSGDAVYNAGIGAVTFIPYLTSPSPCVLTCGPAIKIVKLTNGTNNDAPPGPYVAAGSTVTWTYNVTNTGNVPLANVVVTDDNGTPGNTGDDFTATYVSGDTNNNSLLDLTETWTFTASGTAMVGQYENYGTATGTPPTGPPNVTASNVDHYFGQTPAISIVKKTNGTNNDAPPGPTVAVGSTVTWTYFVTNTGNVPLTNVTVTDDKVGFICNLGTLAANGGTGSCTKTGTAMAGQYTNIGTATGTPPVGPNVTATNPDNYFGQVSCPAPGTISFTGNTYTYGSAGNIRPFSGAGVNVRASAFSRIRSTGTWNTAYLGSYSGGLGVTDGSEGNGGNNTHKIDNIGRDNYVLLEFQSPVVVDRAFLDWVGADSDITVWIGTKADPYNNHQTLSNSFFTGLYTEENATPDVTPGSRWADLNATQVSGNVVVIAAQVSDQSPEDAFKLSKLTLGCPPPPVCAAGTFYFSGNTATSGTAGNTKTFTVNGVSVKASAFSRADNGPWATAYLGVYSGGLGVTDTSEGNGSSNKHKVDNGGGRNNYVLFEFSAPVVVDRAFLDIIGADSDMSAWIGTKPDPFNNHLTLSDNLLTSLGPRQDSPGSTSPRWADINAGNVSGNVLVISAQVGDYAKNDAFKIRKLDIKCP